ncbi:MAG: hypothetical protein GXP26_15260 [Planctomycetes bacterium]|nr:hypothetical protein [Planctomycetota bacterium]
MLTAVTTSTPAAWVACAGAFSLAILLLLRLRSYRGTTLTAPCIWAILSATALALISLLEATSPSQTIARDALRFACAATTFCPIMAVLGAKRPQDRGWQWIVLSLWVVAVWPAVQATLLPTGTQVELFIVWKLFLVGLVAVGLLNYLPTRFGLPSLLVATGQLLLLDNYLWRWHLVPPRLILPLAIACFFAAKITTILLAKNSGQPENGAGTSGLEPFQQQWLTFRNAYGAFWALRILGRVNEAAEFRDWPFRLTWAGLVAHPSDSAAQPSEKQLAELDQTMATLLRRFNNLAAICRSPTVGGPTTQEGCQGPATPN